MNLDEMKCIAAARSPGEWDYRNLQMYFAGNQFEYSRKEANAKFMEMAANNIDKLIAIAEAAKRLCNFYEEEQDSEIVRALKALEQE